MRRFITISFIILALVVSAAGVAPAVHAAGTATEGAICSPVLTSDACAPGLFCMTHPVTLVFTCQKSSADGNGALQTQEQKEAAAAAAKVPKEESSFNLMRKGLNTIMWAITSLFAWLVGVAALMLNYAMYYTVVDMGTYVTKLTAIGTVWSILRDIGNILLIFGFLAIGISVILDSGWYGGGQKLLPKLLIVAVFANFSLFAAEAVIDVGNLFATQIYKQINGGKIPNPEIDPDGFKTIIQQEGVAGVLMTKLGLPAIYGSAKDTEAGGTSGFSSDTLWYMGFMSIILFIVVAFVMFTLAFILISRFIVLILLIMVSPVGIAGLAVPGLQGWANKWWSTLFQQTITAPILLLMLYIALSVIVDPRFFGFGTTTPAWGGIGTAKSMGFAGTLLSYLIAMGLLLAVVYFAKTLSAVGAGWATKTAGKLSFGATAFGLRSTGGAGFQYLARKVSSSERLRGTKTGRVLSAGLGLGAKASFDMRGIAAGGGLKGAGIDAGAAQKGGYRKRQEDSTKAHEAYAKSIEDSEPTRSEERQLETARANTAYKKTLHETAESEHKPIETETVKLRAEVKRLENLSIKSPETDRDLTAARQKLATSETNLVAASTKLAEAAGNLKTWEGKEAVIREDIKNKTSAKAGREKYVESIQGTRSARFSSWAMFGPGGAMAAKKIIKEKKNTVDLDEMKKWLEEKDKPKDETGKEGKEEKKTESKPETPKP